MKRPTLIFAGYFVRYPLGGHVLAELSCLVGFHLLGFDVVFVEESGAEWAPCYDPATGGMTRDPASGLAALRRELDRFGLGANWCYVDSEGRTHGMERARLAQLCRDSELLFSRAGSTWLEEFSLCRNRVYLDVDPGFTQFRLAPQPVASCHGYASPYDFHHHFTLAARIGQPDCPIPLRGLDWKPTRPPFVPELIPADAGPPGERFTTVMSWNAYGEAEFDGEVYGQKSREFDKIEPLPRLIGDRFEVAVASAPPEVIARLRAAGWKLTNPETVTGDLDSYLQYLAGARGEISVAKHGYVKSRSGWFSDRTVAFLGLGRPAVVQDTGFSETIACGEGLFAFGDTAEAERAIRSVERDYRRHAAAARRVVEAYFDYRVVLGALLKQAGVQIPSRLSR